MKELSNDNAYIKCVDLTSLTSFLASMTITNENIDFYWNLLEFHFNVTLQKEGSAGIFSKSDSYLGKIRELLGESASSTDPVTFFKDNFQSKYKLAVMNPGGVKEKDEEIKDEMEMCDESENILEETPEM